MHGAKRLLRYSTESFQKHNEMHDEVIAYIAKKHLLDDLTREKLNQFRECTHCKIKKASHIHCM